MHTKPIRPNVIAVTAAVRGLLAAGWQADACTPMSSGATEYKLIHPSGREIAARVDWGGEQVELRLTGLTVDQAAGAVTGAALYPAEPTKCYCVNDSEQCPRCNGHEAREIKARYLRAGHAVASQLDGPPVVTAVRRDGDTVVATVTGQITYGVEEGVPLVGEAIVIPAAAVDAMADRVAAVTAETEPTSDTLETYPAMFGYLARVVERAAAEHPGDKNLAAGGEAIARFRQSRVAGGAR